MMNKEFIKGILTASIPLLIVGDMKVYLSEANKTDVIKTVIFLPIFYGIVHTVLHKFIKNKIILGLIAGFIYSLLGRFFFKLPQNFWKMKNPAHIHIILPIMWAFLYAYGFPWIKKLFFYLFI